MYESINKGDRILAHRPVTDVIRIKNECAQIIEIIKVNTNGNYFQTVHGSKNLIAKFIYLRALTSAMPTELPHSIATLEY